MDLSGILPEQGFALLKAGGCFLLFFLRDGKYKKK
jgi:hypothetical protein